MEFLNSLGLFAFLLLLVGFVVVFFGILFVYMALAFGGGFLLANAFLAGVVGVAAIFGAAWWWSRPPKKEP